MTKVKIDPRKKQRDRLNALGTDILRYITELVTNCDDSYDRLERENINHDGMIIIKLEKDKRNDEYILSVTDHAEGMSAERLNSIFSNYAGDNADGTGSGVRGIFGQGASDVLQAAASENKIAMIETIKDNKVSKLKYNIDEELDGDIDVVEIPVQGNQLNQLRDNLNIPVNGTKLTFGIPSNVKFGKKIIDNLPDSIEKIPSLRYLLNKNNRTIIYTFENREKVLTSANYQFKDENLVSKKDFNLTFENKIYNCTLSIYENNNKKEDGTNIIVRDQNYAVFDNTMFDFKNSLAAQSLSGELVIPGLYDLCKEHLNREENKDAIVSDNRMGFDQKNQFYITLNQTIYPILNDIISNRIDENKSTNLTNNKRISDALKKLNKYLKNELKDSINAPGSSTKEPPAEGIKFARGNITVTVGKKYDLKLYINPEIISEEDDIEILYFDDDYIEVSPTKFNYSYDEIENNLVTKNITIQGLQLTNDSIKVQARVGTRISNVLIDVIEEEIHYPENGMEFYPQNLSLVIDKPHISRLYVDTETIPLGSLIEIMCDELEVDLNQLYLTQEYLLNDAIACINVVTNGGEVGNQYNVNAANSIYSSTSIINIVEPNQNDKNSGGLISDIQMKKYQSDFQSFIDLSTRVLYINSANPINERMISNIDNLDPENPKFNKEQTKYLCDIIATQAAKFLVVEQTKKGDISTEDAEDTVEQILDLMQKHKNKIYVELYPAMIGTAEEN